MWWSVALGSRSVVARAEDPPAPIEALPPIEAPAPSTAAPFTIPDPGGRPLSAESVSQILGGNTPPPPPRPLQLRSGIGAILAGVGSGIAEAGIDASDTNRALWSEGYPSLFGTVPTTPGIVTLADPGPRPLPQGPAGPTTRP